MRRFLFCGLAVYCAALGSVLSETNATRRLQGFSPQSAATQRSLEERFDAALRKDNLREWMQWITTKPHHLGSPFGREVAEFIAAKFRVWGYETAIETFDVLFPTPKARLLEMTSPEAFSAGLREPQLAED
ncbi:MAG: folate hydrolase, partial [Terriglobia bacterium]